MALTPNAGVTVPDFNNKTTQPNKTYALDFDTGEVGNTVDGLEAVKQAVRKIIYTSRYKFLINSFNYGCEIQDLIGQDLTNAFLQSELERVITEAVEYDDRIDKAYDFDISISNDNIYISFTVDTIQGKLVISEVINNV